MRQQTKPKRRRRDNGDQTKGGSRPSLKGPAENFTGSVRIDPLLDPPEPARAFGAMVTFEPGARTAWHTHPLGQTLIVTSGCGWTQCWGEPKERSAPATYLWCPPGIKYGGTGAAMTTAMAHIAIVEQLDGKAVEWMEKVSVTSNTGPDRAPNEGQG